ncbi:glycosyltransferase family 2 protein [Gordonia otitidis]|uniref:Glycosyltransferase n=1 Tax=Gordonia otitidis (strain DSM 44809 / CCUG 52243 / JCM 12355 / NBRC 100426 / IFM 10032) TaxID=1108044 RepID=H5TKG6_GORO1|nr:glycosyltransferase family 2 protein [Gordonia otitidis]GAB33974.1 putative glycosyltransferase [Gordonia otitidis NBRC 100426]
MAAQPREDRLGTFHLRNIENPRVTALIPAMNEAKNLPFVAARMPDVVDEIVLVDGASIDNTAAVAKHLWPTATILKQSRRGKGNALACGLEAATGDIIVLMDADGSTNPEEIDEYVSALRAGADFAKGSRFIQGGGSSDITRLRSAGNKCLNSVVNVLFRTRYTDLCYGYNALWSDVRDVLDLPDTTTHEAQWGDGFEIETLINVRVAAAQLRITEVASFEQDRIHGTSNLNAVRDGTRVLRTIFSEWSRHRRVAGSLSRAQRAAKTASRKESATGIVVTASDSVPQ